MSLQPSLRPQLFSGGRFSWHGRERKRNSCVLQYHFIGFIAVIILPIYTVSQKSANLCFALCRSNMDRFQYKLVDTSWKKHLTKLYEKCQLHFKYVLAYLATVEATNWAVTQCLHVHFNESSNSHKDHWYSHCLKKIVRRVVSYTICSICANPARIPRCQMSTNWNDSSRMSEQSESRCLLNVCLVTWRQRLHARLRAGGRYFQHIM